MSLSMLYQHTCFELVGYHVARSTQVPTIEFVNTIFGKPLAPQTSQD